MSTPRAIEQALGPAFALVADGWNVAVSIPGRWGSSSVGSLSSAAPILWALAAGMMVVGILGLIRRPPTSVTETGVR